MLNWGGLTGEIFFFRAVTTNREKSADVIVVGKVKKKSATDEGLNFNETSNLFKYLMKEPMQKMTSDVGFPQNDRTESEVYEGVQTFMWIEDGELVEVQTSTCNLLELILSPSNLNRAYRQVVGNGGAGGVDKMGTSELLPYIP